ncbi:MAG: hypothetical protein HMLKMBBP_03385 [Planctomycetes bacterium]|nr:hypothetical protein [Planctomycetota bacterium]
MLRKTIDPKGNEVEYVADGLGRTLERREDMGSSQTILTKWAYDDFDRVTKLTDDNNSDTDYAYNVLGQLTQKTYENAKTVSYQYDAGGNVTVITDQSGTEIDQVFNDLDQLVARDLTLASGVGGDTDEDFQYDALGRLTEAKDNDSIVQYTYDSLSRVLTEVQGSNPLGSTGKTVTYTYDDDGNRTKIDYPSGFDANETRDALGRLTEVKDASNASIAAFDLYGAGLRRKKTSFGNGNTSELVYDGFRRPVEINHKYTGGSEFAGQDYAWDKNDNPLMEKRSHESGKGDVYTYDKANRLTKVLTDVVDPAAELATPGSQNYQDKLEYDMDDVFNLTAYKVTPQGGSLSTTSYTTNAMNEYTAVGGVTHVYTDNGALKDDGTNTYKYDGHDRLIEVTRKSDSVVIGTYKYDAVGLGRRTKKTVPVSGGTKTTRYVYAGLQSIEELDGSSGNLDRLFVFGGQIDQILAMESPDHADVDGDSNTSEVLRFSYHVQLIGSVTHVTAPSGSVVESYRYDPYGKPTIKDAGGSTVTSSAIRNPYLYTARQLDEETGLYYYRARMYSDALRRFIQRDPIEYASTPNSLGYVRAQATVLRDSTGLKEEPPPANEDTDHIHRHRESTDTQGSVTAQYWRLVIPGNDPVIMHRIYQSMAGKHGIPEIPGEGRAQGFTKAHVTASEDSISYEVKERVVASHLCGQYWAWRNSSKRDVGPRPDDTVVEYQATCSIAVSWSLRIEVTTPMPGKGYEPNDESPGWSATQKAAWDTFVAALRQHESEHVKSMTKNFNAALRTLPKKFSSRSDWMSDAEAAKAQALERARASIEEARVTTERSIQDGELPFDLRTRHGKTGSNPIPNWPN